MTTLSLLLYCYFTAGILGSLFAHFAQKVFGPSALFSHGKAAIINSQNRQKCNQRNLMFKFLNWITSLTVSKHLFWHFYAFGLLSSLTYVRFKSSDICAILLAVQCFRRLVECFLVMPGAKGSQMHLIHYGIGITYYPVLLLSFESGNKYKYMFSYYWIILYIAASVFQSYCHWILGSIRKATSKTDQPHRPIQHPLFKFIHAPHYLAELLIYTSIAGLQGFHPLMLLNLVWIVTILGVSAKNSADWLCDRWGYKGKESFCKYLMIPFLF